MRCDDYQALLLDHLYGLLDAADAAALEQHLAGCGECASARHQAARVQGLLARAAKSEFPQVQFVPPAEPEPAREEVLPFRGPQDNGQPSAPAQPSTVAGAHSQSVRAGWARWAIAAGLLIVAPALLLPLINRSREYESAKGKADEAATHLADARKSVEKAQSRSQGLRSRAEERFLAARDRTQAVLRDWVAAEKAADAAEKNRQVAIAVSRPQSIIAGAPNEFRVAIDDRGGVLRGKRVEAEVRDRDGKTLHTQRIETGRKDDSQTVRLPTEVWTKVTPQSELFLSVAAVDEKTSARTVLQEPIRLFGPVYTTLLTTDKSAYRPGERIFFRSLTLDRVSFRPPDREQVLEFSLRRLDGSTVPGTELYGTTGVVRVADGSVEPVLGPDGQPLRGVGCGAIALPTDLADGEYVLTLAELPGRGGLPPVQAYPVRKIIEVRSGRPGRFAKAIGFTAASFAPGQAVDAWAEVKSQDRPVAGVTARAVVTVDGNPLPLVRVTPQPVGPDGKAVPTTGPDGRVRIRFVLPKDTRGDVRLQVTFQTKDAGESIARRVPIAGRDIVVEFFPEGGNLIAGVPNRVYIRATTADGRPVDVRGEVIADSEVVAKVESPKDEDEPGVNRGLGSFTFTPRADAAYRFKLTGMPDRAPFELPKVEPDGVAMTVPSPVVAAGEPIVVRLNTAGTKPRKLIVGAYTRGRMADTQKATVKPGEPAEVQLIANGDPRGGVTRITVFEEPANPGADVVPVAERLVFRRPGEVLHLAASAGAPGTVFAPGSPVELNITATDEKGNPVPAIVWAAAVNSAVAPGAKDRSLPSHFLLAGEIETPDDLEYADFLLTDHAKAAESLDLVLATQGWRRFVEQAGPAAIAKGQRDRAELMVKSGAYPVAAASRATREHRRLYQQFWPKYGESVKELDTASEEKAAADRAANDPALADLFALYEARRGETAEATKALRSAAQPLLAFRPWINVGAAALAILAAVLAVVAIVRPNGVRGLAPLLVSAVAAGGLAAFLAIEASRPVAVEEAGDETGGQPSRPHMSEVPAPLVEPEGPQRIAKGPLKNGTVEPRALSGATDPTKPPKLPVLPKRAPSPLESFQEAPGGELIPDPTLREKPRMAPPMRLMSTQVDSGSREAELRILSKIADFARERAVPLAAPIEDLLPERQESAHDRIRESVPWAPPLVVREYAAPRPGSTPREPVPSDTVLWKPVLVLPTSGKTTVSFHPGDAPAGYQVLVAGHTLDGRIGSIRTILRVAPGAPAPSK